MPTFEEVYRAFQEEGNQTKAAARLGIAGCTVSSILRKNGICVGQGKRPPRAESQKVYDDYMRTKSQIETGRLNGISKHRVGQILREQFAIGNVAGLTNPKALPTEEIAALYAGGLTCQKIGEKYGVSWNCIRENLLKNGYAMRTRKEHACRGASNPNWTGGNYTRNRKARGIVEEYAQRKLLQDSVVHHHDMNPKNNSLDNLWIFPSQSSHKLYHHSLLRHQNSGSKVDATLLALGNGGWPLLILPCLNVLTHATGLLALFETEQMPASALTLF